MITKNEIQEMLETYERVERERINSERDLVNKTVVALMECERMKREVQEDLLKMVGVSRPNGSNKKFGGKRGHIWWLDFWKIGRGGIK